VTQAAALGERRAGRAGDERRGEAETGIIQEPPSEEETTREPYLPETQRSGPISGTAARAP
jgi:hypothetical protein